MNEHYMNEHIAKGFQNLYKVGIIMPDTWKGFYNLSNYSHN